MDIKGTLLEISDTAQVTESFQKREFVVEYKENPNFPEYLKFELIQDRCSLIDGFNVNDEVTVHFNLKGRKWTDRNGEVKYFNSLQAWKIDAVSSGDTPPPPPTQEDWTASDEESDVLPF